MIGARAYPSLGLRFGFPCKLGQQTNKMLKCRLPPCVQVSEQYEAFVTYHHNRDENPCLPDLLESCQC
eukprot:5829875-Amphidinium_carterae.1